jgi:hypothetical protein
MPESPILTKWKLSKSETMALTANISAKRFSGFRNISPVDESLIFEIKKLLR